MLETKSLSPTSPVRRPPAGLPPLNNSLRKFGRTFSRRGGRPLCMGSGVVPFFGSPATLSGYRETEGDVAAWLVAEKEPPIRDATLESILKASPIGIGLVENRIIRWTNDFFLEMVGYSAEEIKGKSSRLLYESDEEFERAGRVKYGEIRSRGIGTVETRMRRKDGAVIDVYLSSVAIDRNNPCAGVCFTVMDITARKRHERDLEYMATHDSLTALANRRLLADRIRQSLAYARRSDKMVALVLLDLARFKGINDTLGHRVGDAVLREVARRLTATVRSCDTVARFGGDEFAVVLVELDDPAQVGPLAQKIHKNLSRPLTIQDHELQVGASIGIACFPQDGLDAEDLIHKADLAMYRAKRSGGGFCRFAAL